MKKIKKIVAVAFAVCLPATAFAQETSTSEVRNLGAVPYLGITPDARSAGMALTGTALNQGAFSVFHNAASVLSSEKSIGAGYSFSPWNRELHSGYNLHTIGAYYQIDSKNALSLGFRYYGQPKNESEGWDDAGNPVNLDFGRPTDFAIDLAYSRHLVDGLYASLTARYVNSKMADIQDAKTASAVGFDIGIFYQRRILGMTGADWAVGVSASNFGTKIKYVNNEDNMPAYLKAGGAVNLPFTPDHKLTAAIDLSYQLVPSEAEVFNVGIGAEYTLFRHGIIRAGYHISDKDKGGYGNFATLGLGGIIGPVRIDASYWITDSDSVYKNTFGVSAAVYF